MMTDVLDAVIFDLDGVITNSTPLHSRAWKEMFDEFLKEQSSISGAPFREFTHEEDYLAYVDGKPRYTGVKSFLESRGFELPFGDPDQPPGQDTICGLGNLKNEIYNQLLSDQGVEIYASSVEFIHTLKDAGVKLGLATSSKNASRVLELTGLIDLFQTRVDGVVSAELGLEGKPAPDIFHTACDRLGASYERSVIIEDANSGVEAGYRGHFGLVLGVAREDNREELELHGADLVVEDLNEITIQDIENWFREESRKKSWFIEYRSYDPQQEGTREALCAVGNGYFCTRGSLEEVPANLDENYPGTYLAGLYNRLESNIGGRVVSNEDFVNCPNWLPITFRLESGDWFDPLQAEILDFHRKLDLESGLLSRDMVVRDQEGNQTRIKSSRLVSMADPNLAAMEYTITPLNYTGNLTVRSELDGSITNQGVKRYRELSSRHLEPIQGGGDGPVSYLEVVTNQSGIRVGLAARLRVRCGDAPASPDYRVSDIQGRVSTTFEVDARSDSPVCIQKTVCLHSDNHPDVDRPLDASREKLARSPDFEQIYQESAAAWREIWDHMDVRIRGDRLAQKMVRLHLYHTLVSYSAHSAALDAGIPARGLHGEAYRGHIFWDELYILPFFSLHFPTAARAALKYRYRRLPAARKAAAADGLPGAQFPWQSGSDGGEETQKLHLNPISGKWGPDYSHLQRHVSLAILYNVWTHFWITGEDDFLVCCGAELVLSICRYWAGLAKWRPSRERYWITGVMGPDEFHETYPGSEEPGLTNNAYSNLMLAWAIRQARRILDLLSPDQTTRLLEKLKISQEELDTWEKISSKVALSISPEGILEQFRGYFDLEELDWEHYIQTYGDIHRLDRILKSENLSPNAYKVAKQADVLMLFYNLPEDTIADLIRGLGYQIPDNLLERNLHYYLQRTSHGSTLSRLVHAYLAHQAGNLELSWKLYQEALRSDFLDIQGGTTREGIHLGVMTGTIISLYRSYAGLDWNGECLCLAPSLPPGWRCLEFNLTFKGVRYYFRIQPRQIEIKTSSLKEQEIQVQGSPHLIPPDKWLLVDLV